jgi:cbb3-type cytochrome oxidase maturation protein
MDILFLLVPVSVLLALGVVGLLAWSVWSGQFEDVESEGQRIFQGSDRGSLSTTQKPED